MSLGTSGLGAAGLAEAGVGLGGAGLQLPAAAGGGFDPQDADQYSVSQDEPGPSAARPRFRYDMRWRPDGGRVFFRAAVGDNNPAVDNLFQYDVSPAWSLDTSNFTNLVSIEIGSDTNARTFEWVNDGDRLVFMDVWFSSFRRFNSFPASTPYDISTLGSNDSTYTNLVGTGQFGMKWNEDWTKVILTRSGEWTRYNVATPGLPSTITGVDQTWSSATGSSMALAPGELKLYVISGSTLRSFDLDSPFSIDPDPANNVAGPDMNLPTSMTVVRGLNINPDTGELFATADQNSFRLRSWVTP